MKNVVTITEYNAVKMLHFLSNSGMVNVNDVENMMKQKEKEEIINTYHKNKITKGKDGRWRTYVKTENGRKLIAKSTKEKVEDSLIQFYTIKEDRFQWKNACLKDLFPKWIKYKELKGAAKPSIRKLNTHWRKYYADSEISKTPVCDLDWLTLDQWAHELVKVHQLTKKEYMNVSTIMRQCLSYAIELGILEMNYLSQVHINPKLFKKVQKKTDEQQVFTKEELRKLTELAWKEIENGSTRRKHKLLPLALLFQTQTGLRVGELAALRYSDLTADQTVICVQRMYRFEEKEIDEYTKGSYGDRMVPLTEEAQRIIKTAREIQEKLHAPTNGYIFSVFDTPPTYHAFIKLYHSYCDQIQTQRKTTHSARRTFVSALLDNNCPISTVSQLCGHVDTSTTLNNYCYDMHTKEEKQKLLETALSWSA